MKIRRGLTRTDHQNRKKKSFKILSNWRQKDLNRIFDYKPTKEHRMLIKNFVACVKMVIPYAPATAEIDIWRQMKKHWTEMKFRQLI